MNLNMLFSELSPQSKAQAMCKCGECGFDARHSHHSCTKCGGKMMVSNNYIITEL